MLSWNRTANKLAFLSRQIKSPMHRFQNHFWSQLKEGKRRARTSELHPQGTGTALTRTGTGPRLHGEDGDHEMVRKLWRVDPGGFCEARLAPPPSLQGTPPPSSARALQPMAAIRWMLSQVMKSVYHPGYER